MLVHRRVTRQKKDVGTHLFTWVKREKEEWISLSNKETTRRARLLPQTSKSGFRGSNLSATHSWANWKNFKWTDGLALYGLVNANDAQEYSHVNYLNAKASSSAEFHFLRWCLRLPLFLRSLFLLVNRENANTIVRSLKLIGLSIMKPSTNSVVLFCLLGAK